MSDAYEGWTREQIEARVAFLEAEVFEIERLLAQMDPLGYDAVLDYAPTYSPAEVRHARLLSGEEEFDG